MTKMEPHINTSIMTIQEVAVDPIYCQVIINRWESLTGKTSKKIC